MQRFLIMAVVIVCCGDLWAQQTFRSLEELWKYADEHNVQISSSRIQEEVAALGVRQVKSAFLPGVNLNGAFTDNVSIQPTLVPAELFGGEPGTFVEEKFGKRYNYNAGVNVQLDLLKAGNWFAVREAHLGVAAANLNSKLGRQNVYLATSNAYLSYYLMHESETLAEESFRTAEVMLAHATNLYRQGQISQVALNSASIYFRSAAISLQTLRQNKENALNQLKQWLEMSVADSLVLPTDLSGHPFRQEDDAALVFSEHNSVKLARVQVETAKNSWRASRATYLPTLTVVYAFSTQLVGDQILNFDDANRLPQQYWGLRLTIPLLAQGTRNIQVSKTRLDYAAAADRYESTLRQTALSDQDLVGKYQTAKDKLKVVTEILALYRNNDEHAARQLDAGQISLDDRLRVYQDYLSYKNEYLYSLSDFYAQYAGLKVRQQLF